MSEQIKIDTGLKVYDIVNLDGEKIGVFKFNPNDTGIVRRYEEVLKHLESVKIEMGNEEENENSFDTFIRLEDEVKAQMRYLIGNDSSDVFFEVTGAFSMLPTGELYIEQIIGAIGGLIKSEGENRKKLLRKKIEKYTNKYRK